MNFFFLKPHLEYAYCSSLFSNSEPETPERRKQEKLET